MVEGKRPEGEERPPAIALRKTVRVQIVAACTERETASKEFAEREEMPIANAGYYFQKLEKEGFLRVARKEPARGARKYYYAAIRQAIITDEEFAVMTQGEQREFSKGVLKDLLNRVRQADLAGTFEGRSGPLIRLAHFELDDQGWCDLMKQLLAAFQHVLEIQIRSTVRRRRVDERSIPATCALAGFPSPPGRPPEGDELMMDFFHRASQALRAGTLNSRSDNHLTWIPMELDERGWSELKDTLERLRLRSLEVEAESTERLRDSGAAPIPTTFAAAFFESPPHGGPPNGPG